MDRMSHLVGTLMQSRNQTHIYHLQTNSYAAHKALNKYYEYIVDHIDTLAEQYQGKYGIIKGYSMEYSLREDDNYVVYFEALLKFVELTRQQIPQDSFLQNTVDEITSLISTTLYKVRELH